MLFELYHTFVWLSIQFKLIWIFLCKFFKKRQIKVNVSSVNRKIKKAYEVSTNAELAIKLGITVSAIEAWSRRKSIPDGYLFQCVNETGVSLDWLLDEDKPTFHISGGNKNISQVNGGTINQGFDKNEALEFFEEFKKIENLARITGKVDFLKEELEKIKVELIKYL